MKKILWTFVVILMFSHVSRAETVLPEFQGGFQTKAMWKVPNGVIQTMMQDCSQHARNAQDFRACQILFMQQHCASEQAIAFFKAKSAWIQDFRRYQPVTVVKSLVMAADHSEEFFIINSKGVVIDVDDYNLLKTINLNSKREFKDILKRYPKATLWFGGHHFPTPAGPSRLIFSYVIKDGCNACAIAGHAWLAFDFDTQGNFKSIKLIHLM